MGIKPDDGASVQTVEGLGGWRDPTASPRNRQPVQLERRVASASTDRITQAR